MSIQQVRPKTAQSEGMEIDFDALFQSHWASIYDLIYRLVGDPAEAEDLALETFVRLHQRPPRNRANLPGWLYRVATRLGLNALRARKRRVFYETKAGQIRLQGSLSDNPAAQVERAEERWRVRQALARMRKRSAQILILRHAGLTYAQVAAAVGVSPGSVGTLLARAEQEFKRHYQN